MLSAAGAELFRRGIWGFKDSEMRSKLHLRPQCTVSLNWNIEKDQSIDHSCIRLYMVIFQLNKFDQNFTMTPVTPLDSRLYAVADLRWVGIRRTRNQTSSVLADPPNDPILNITNLRYRYDDDTTLLHNDTCISHDTRSVVYWTFCICYLVTISFVYCFT